ncbi:efflux RND transporter permease subunit [Elusimicrobiota bacterium]
MWENIIAYFAKRHLLTNLIYVCVLIGGIFAWQNTNKEEMPSVTFNRVRVSVSYPGAPAEDVEYFVAQPIEEKLRGLDGIYRVTSTCNVGQASISVELEHGLSNLDEAVMEIRNTVLDVKLPDGVIDDPRIRVFKTSKKAIIDLALYHTQSPILDIQTRAELQGYALALENRLLSLSAINSVNRRGYLQEEIQIKVDPKKLQRYDIPFNTVTAEISANHLRQPAGSIEAKGEPKVTLHSELNTAQKLKDLIVQGGFEGSVIRLGQLADIKRGYAKSKTVSKVNGYEAVTLNVVKNGSYGILEALDATRKVAMEFKNSNLKGTPIVLTLLDDESIDVRNRLRLIVVNGSIGFILIVFTLFLVLSRRAGLWVAMGIPFSFAFTMIASNMLGYTINGTTLAAVIIVMGIVVDDAIVVAEHISRLVRQGVARSKAVVQGTNYMTLPIIASIVTTCVAFVPLFFFSGHFGRFVAFIPPIIFLMLGASLFESIFILPAHMDWDVPIFKRIFPSGKKSNGSAGQRFDRIEDAYGLWLEKVLGYKWFVIASLVALLAAAGWLVTKKMKFVMFPREETRNLQVTGNARKGAARYETAKATRKIEDVIAPYLGKEVVGVRTSVGSSRRGGAGDESQFRMTVEIVPKEKRKKSSNQILEEIDSQIQKLEGFRKLKFRKHRWGHESGSPIEIIVQNNNDQERESVLEDLKTAITRYPDLANPEVDEGLFVPAYRISVKRDKIKRLSIGPKDIASTFRAALEGTVLYDFPDKDEKVRVRLTTVDDAKDDINKVLAIPVENRRNYLVPLRDIVDVEKIQSPNSIARRDMKRTSVLYADMTPGVNITPVDAAEYLEENVFPDILARYPSTALSFGGEVEDTRESGKDFLHATIMAIVLIYGILAVLFNSATKPLLIMLSIPFGMVGIALAFLLHGKVLFGFFAAVGALGLAGVVINDSIIMLIKLDDELRSIAIRTRGHIAKVAQTRLRAVVLTTVTTVAGVLPTAYGFAGYDAMLAEMMLALAWGLVFGTVVTLVLVPCLYSISEDIKGVLTNTNS